MIHENKLQAEKRQEIVVNSSELSKNQSENKAAHILAMIVGTFIVLWTPGIVSLFIIAVTGNREFPLDILQLSTILVHLNSAIDPIIYACRMKNVREVYCKIFKINQRKKNSSPCSDDSELKSARNIKIASNHLLSVP